MKEKQKELEKRIVMKSSTNCVSEEDMKKNVSEEIELRLREKKLKGRQGKMLRIMQ